MICVSIARFVISRRSPARTWSPTSAQNLSTSWQTTTAMADFERSPPCVLGLASRVEIGQWKFVSVGPQTTTGGVENRKTFFRQLGKASTVEQPSRKKVIHESKRVTQCAIFQVVESPIDHCSSASRDRLDLGGEPRWKKNSRDR